MEHRYSMSWECKGHIVIDCQSCGFKHTYPLPGQQELENFYEEKYFRDIKPVDYNSITDAKTEKTKIMIMDDESFKNTYDKVIALLNTTRRGMVDVGCGNLLLSHFFKNKGWKEYVIEPSKEAGAYLKQFGLNVINQPIENVDIISFKEISFINLQFVLEHISNPIEMLRKAYEVLEPGGIIRICVPNDFSEGQLAYMEGYNEKPRWICLPDHINYFNFESLNGLLNKVGFSEVYRTTDFPLEFLLMGGMNYYASEEEKKVGPFINNLTNCLRKTGREKILETLYEILAKNDFGRSIYMYAIKPL